MPKPITLRQALDGLSDKDTPDGIRWLLLSKILKRLLEGQGFDLDEEDLDDE